MKHIRLNINSDSDDSDVGGFFPTNVDVDGDVDGLVDGFFPCFPPFFHGNLLENSPAPEPQAWPAPAPGRASRRPRSAGMESRVSEISKWS